MTSIAAEIVQDIPITTHNQDDTINQSEENQDTSSDDNNDDNNTINQSEENQNTSSDDNESTSTTSTSPSLNAFCEGFGSTVSNFFQTKYPNLIVNYSAGGSFNRVLTIDTTDHQYILRLPREDHPTRSTDILTNISLLHFLSSINISHLPIPKIISYDLTPNNPLNSQYTLQTRLPGTPVDYVLDSLSLLQRCTLATQLATVLSKILTIDTFKGSGRLVTDPKNTNNIRLAPPRVLLPPSDYAYSFAGALDQTGSDYVQEYSPPTGLLNWYVDHFDLLKISAENNFNPLISLYCQALKKLAVVLVETYIQECNKSDTVYSSRNCLYHPDIADRNLLVAVDLEENESDLNITGVIDWDDTSVIPSEIAYTLPSWLWNNFDSDKCYPILEEEQEGHSEEEDTKIETETEQKQTSEIKSKIKTPPLEFIFSLNERNGDDPDAVLLHPNQNVIRQCFYKTINQAIPNYIHIYRQSRKHGLRSLGFLARHGLGTIEQLKLSKMLLKRYNMEKDLEKILNMEMNIQKRDVLMDAAEAGNVKKLKKLLSEPETKEIMDMCDGYGSRSNALLLAARYGGVTEESSYACMEVLLKTGASVTVVDGDGNSCLSLSAFKVKVRCVELLLQNKDVDVNVQNGNGHTALMSVCMGPLAIVYPEKVVKIVKLLIDAGADVTLLNVKNENVMDKAKKINVLSSVVELLESINLKV